MCVRLLIRNWLFKLFYEILVYFQLLNLLWNYFRHERFRMKSCFARILCSVADWLVENTRAVGCIQVRINCWLCSCNLEIEVTWVLVIGETNWFVFGLAKGIVRYLQVWCVWWYLLFSLFNTDFMIFLVQILWLQVLIFEVRLKPTPAIRQLTVILFSFDAWVKLSSFLI